MYVSDTYKLDQVTAPAVEPVDLATAKNYLKVDGNTDDTLITDIIVAARMNAESYTKRAYINQDWTLWLNEWPSSPSGRWYESNVQQLPKSITTGRGEIQLPLAPLSTVVFIRTWDQNDAQAIVDPATYRAIAYAGPYAQRGVLKPISTQTWPTGTVLRNIDPIEIIFTAGYGATANDVPAPIKQAILYDVAEMYKNRGADCDGCCSLSRKLLQRFRIMDL